jgi:hypothetical protein
MMGSRIHAAMSPFAAGRLAGAVALLVPLCLAQPVAAAPAAAAYPPAETFRRIQLSAFACGRDNTSTSCDQARSQADKLLDHPRLASSCKDALWEVRQTAQTAPSNSFARRDPIDEAANRVRLVCRQPAAAGAAAKSTTAPAGGDGGSGGNSGSGGSGGFRFGSP